jgi:hypothetical protein
MPTHARTLLDAGETLRNGTGSYIECVAIGASTSLGKLCLVNLGWARRVGISLVPRSRAGKRGEAEHGHGRLRSGENL